MMTRAFRIGLLAVLLLPLASYADDAALLGPQATTPSTAQVGPSNPQSSGILQPAGTGSDSAQPLQSADANAGGTGQAGASQTLQQTGNSDAAKLLVQGDGDQPHEPDAGLPWWEIAGLIAVAMAAAGLAWWLWRQARRPVAPALSQAATTTSLPPTEMESESQTETATEQTVPTEEPIATITPRKAKSKSKKRSKKKKN
jgi:hypothetical protein